MGAHLTGYGVQTALFASRFRDAGHDVAIASMWGLNGAALEWDGITVYPEDGRYGAITLNAFAKRHQADLVVTLLDVHGMQPGIFADLRAASWVPVDHQPCPPMVAGWFRQSGSRPIAMSRFGERMLIDEGLNPLYVPHGIDLSVFKPSEPVLRMRDELKDRFIVGMVANNHGHTPPRKAFPQALMAFSAFYRDHPDAYLYLHTEATGLRSPAHNRGVNIERLLERYEIPTDAVGITSQLDLLDVGIPGEWMASLYSSFDVLLNPSYGEGFGVPLVEAQACGTPIIVTDWTSMPELVGAGWKVGGEPWDDVQQDAFFMAPSTADIIAALEQAYEHRDNLTLKDQAVKFAQQYDADLVMEQYWTPVLEELLRPREVGPLPNRAMRRAAKKNTPKVAEAA